MLLLILFPVHIKEDNASAVTGTATSSSTSLTLTSGKNTASVAITPTNASGAFATSSSANKAEFGISTNNYTGYTLAITASDDTGNLVNTTTSDTIASITTNLTESSFNTSTYNNKWGFKPNKYVSNNTVITNTGDDSVYLPSPTTTGTILDHTNTANSSANTYTIALGIRADHNTTAGTYSKTFTLVATANPTTYTINYNKNTTDSVSNMPTISTAGSTTATSINLPNTVPTRAHYSFLGWCSSTTTTSNGIDSCSGTVYNPNGAGTNLTYGLDQTTANTTTTLYAMWKIDTFTLTLAKGSNITNITASPNNANGVYNYGQEIILTAYKTTNTTCKSYATPTWSTTAGTLSATSGNSITITMPASNVTVTAASAESNIPQTITLSKGTGVNGITIDGTKYTGTSASLTCGQHNIRAPSSNFNSGYEFSGWAVSGSISVASTSINTDLTVNGPGTLTLNGKSSKLYLQNVTSATCPTTATTAYDSRDEEAYTIQKLADGKCWLLDNLRLDLTNATVKNNLTASTTNASATTLNYLKNGGGTDSDQYAMIGVITTWDNSQYRYSAPKIAASGTGDKGSWTKNTIASFAIGQSGSGKIGIYYNYCAASAGSYCYGDATTGYGAPSSNATEDICPAGWRMPTGGASGEYQALYTAYGNKVTFINALRTPLSGTFNNNSAYWQGQSGSFWSSTREGNYRMYYLGVGTSDIYLQERNQRYSGQSVRCVAK